MLARLDSLDCIVLNNQLHFYFPVYMYRQALYS